MSERRFRCHEPRFLGTWQCTCGGYFKPPCPALVAALPPPAASAGWCGGAADGRDGLLSPRGELWLSTALALYDKDHHPYLLSKTQCLKTAPLTEKRQPCARVPASACRYRVYAFVLIEVHVEVIEDRTFILFIYFFYLVHPYSFV